VFINVSEELSEKTTDLQSGNASARSDPASAGFYRSLTHMEYRSLTHMERAVGKPAALPCSL
jgi:hypothetical protein